MDKVAVKLNIIWIEIMKILHDHKGTDRPFYENTHKKVGRTCVFIIHIYILCNTI